MRLPITGTMPRAEHLASMMPAVEESPPRPSLLTSTDPAHQQPSPILPVGPASTEVVTALDRLIQHAESIDRGIPLEHDHRAPTPSMTDEIDPLWRTNAVPATVEPGSFEAHLRNELAVDESLPQMVMPESPARPEPVAPSDNNESAPPLNEEPRMNLPTPLESEAPTPLRDLPLEPAHDLLTGSTTLVDDTVESQADDLAEFDTLGEEDSAIDDDEVIAAESSMIDDDEVIDDDETTDATASPLVETDINGPVAAMLAPPSALLNPDLFAPTLRPRTGPIEELDALLRDVGVDLEDADPTVPLAAMTPPPHPSIAIDDLAVAATERLIGGVLELQRESTQPLTKLSVSVTAPDGTTLSVSTEFQHEAATPSSAVLDEIATAVSAADVLADEFDGGVGPDDDTVQMSVGESVLLSRVLDLAHEAPELLTEPDLTEMDDG